LCVTGHVLDGVTSADDLVCDILVVGELKEIGGSTAIDIFGDPDRKG
jgi:hypothetical protein